MRWVLVLLAVTVLSLSSISAQELQVFLGNLHSHTDYSDGQKKPKNAYKHAQDKATIDFLLISEHNHSAAGEIAGNTALYTGTSGGSSDQGLIPTAGRFIEDGEFVALYGQEFSTISSGNHINVFDVPEVIDVGKGKFKDLVAWIENADHHDTSGQAALLQFNHPWASSSPNSKEYGRDDFGSDQKWIQAMDKHAQLIEVVNGPAFTEDTGVDPAHILPSHYLTYLNLGFHLAPTANQDNHRQTWGNATDARTGVIAASLTKSSIMTALRSRHAYASTDKNLKVIARTNSHLMGDVITNLPTEGAELEIELTISDGDESNAEYLIEVLSDDGPGGSKAEVVASFDAVGNTSTGEVLSLGGVHFSGNGQYLLLEITQVNEVDEDNSDQVWTAPVWFESGTTTPATGGQPRLVSVLPNSVSPESENEEATIKNVGTEAVSMVGWKLRDLAGNTWDLDSLATINAGQQKTIKRNGQSMALNNGGDTVELLNPDGDIVQTESYGSAAEGQTITFPQ